MSALVQPISETDSLALLRQRMIREVEIFLEGRIAPDGHDAGQRMIPTRTASSSRPADASASWYHNRLGRSSAAAAASAGEAGSC